MFEAHEFAKDRKGLDSVVKWIVGHGGESMSEKLDAKILEAIKRLNGRGLAAPGVKEIKAELDRMMVEDALELLIKQGKVKKTEDGRYVALP